MKINQEQFECLENNEDIVIGGYLATLSHLGEWLDEGKTQYHEMVFKWGGKYYTATERRSGSYFTDWYYCWEDTKELDCTEVKPVKVTVIEWHAV